VQYVFKDFPLEQLHPQAFRAAEAAHCAGEQGRFWEMHDRLFANQAALSAGDFRRLAEELRLDLSRFQACLESGRYAARIRRDLAEGNRLGITGTPTFLLGITPSSGSSVRVLKIIRGAKSFSDFQQAIEEVLAER
jgi:protein-disulfide isomerase